MVGDIDPIKAAQAGLNLADELTMHYGLLPRANRGIFAINELPDLAGKIQVGLFNILEERDVQIRGYPIQFDLDVMILFSANPATYNRSGKVIPQLKDRISVRGDARKFVLVEPEQSDEAWTKVPTELHVAGLTRPIYPRRGAYYEQLRRIWAETNGSAATTLSQVIAGKMRALAVADTEYVVTFAGMGAVAWVISSQATRARAQTAEHSAREERAQALYRLSDRLAGETQMFDTARAAAEA